MTKTAVIIGVGPLRGLGAVLAQTAARQDLHVVVAGRTKAKLEAVVAAIRATGGLATAIACDTTEEEQVIALIDQAECIGPIDLAIYNAGNNMPGGYLDMEASYFDQCYRVCLFGGFLFSREALRRMTPRGKGCLIFTGASASMRGKPWFAAFTAAKGGLRNLAQSLARDFQPKGIHVGHVVIDGGIYGEKIQTRLPDWYAEKGEDGLIDLQGIADAYLFLYQQPSNAWTHELDLRTHLENF
ncbi:MAG: SDR family NAD(P)-dependent oxidoreductase [Gammaproteobacteria bacterium]|nr:SDR family NAD(P)-dependent oxidoreductase [Gammaproteobacteria bacterium]